MSLFSFLRKNGQESATQDGTYYSRAEEDSKATRSRKRKASARRDDAAADPVLPEKKRARRRLVGAIALVLAAIIGLPMILDSEPKPVPDDIAIQIPARDSLPPVAPPVVPPAPVPATAEAEADPVAASLGAKEELVAVAPSPSTKKPEEKPAATPTEPAPVPAARSPEPAPAPVSASPTAPSAKPLAPRSEDGARALALLQGKPDPRRDEAGEKFVIQVAALVSQQKVNELQEKLKRAGIASFTQKVSTQSGTATRIRVGPFSSREEAEKIRDRIVKLGLNGTLVPV